MTQEEYENDIELNDKIIVARGGPKPGILYPFYPRSIEAAYALEDEVPEDQQEIYAQFLVNIIFRDTDKYVSTYRKAHATPRQRCEAWLAWTQQRGEGVK